MMFDTMPSVWPQVVDGKLRALAVTSAERAPFLPDLPAIAETLPGFRRRVVARHHGAGRHARRGAARDLGPARILADPALVQWLRDLGAVARNTGPEEFSAFIRKDFEKWRRVTRETGIRLDN